MGLAWKPFESTVLYGSLTNIDHLPPSSLSNFSSLWSPSNACNHTEPLNQNTLKFIGILTQVKPLTGTQNIFVCYHKHIQFDESDITNNYFALLCIDLFCPGF